METRAYLKGTRLSPQKAGLVADVIRGKPFKKQWTSFRLAKRKAQKL